MGTELSRRSFIRQAVTSVGVAGLAVHNKRDQCWGQVSVKTPPRFAICNETFGDWPFEKAFSLAAECGYQGLEIAPFTISDDVTDISIQRRSEVRKQAERAGLKVVGLHWLLARTEGLHLTSPDREVRRRTSQYLGELAKFCADLGGKLLVFGSPQQRNLGDGITFEAGLEFATDVIHQALPILERNDVTLAMEPLLPTKTNFLSNANQAMQLIKKVDSARCRLILDCHAMAAETVTIPTLIREHHDELVHFHANDPNRLGPGFGELDFVPVLESLADVEFNGWISVEVFDYAPGPERLARESINYLRKCLPE